MSLKHADPCLAHNEILSSLCFVEIKAFILFYLIICYI